MSRYSKKRDMLIRLADEGQGVVRWEDLQSLLEYLGFTMDASTGGSHRSFHHNDLGCTLSGVVKPHPRNEVKKYMARKVVEFLRAQKLI